MKKLYVCGDSFMTPSLETPGLHFTEILSKQINYELTTYSRGGMSNGGIGIQIESAIKMKPDLIILNTTMVDRMEIWVHSAQRQTKGVDEIDVNDLYYRHGQSISSYNTDLNKNSHIISDTIESMLPDYRFTQYENYIDNLSEIKKAVKIYFSTIYDFRLKHKIDNWCMYAILHKLHLSKIPYLIVLDHLMIIDKCPWLETKHIGIQGQPWWDQVQSRIETYNNQNSIKFSDPGYHTLPEDQVILANHTQNHLIKHGFI
jgi:hypothetical protein